MRVIVKKKGENQDTPLMISTEYIKLESALKLANVVSTGGEAKVMILEGNASVNGEVCLMRGKKLYPGDRFAYMGRKFVIRGNESV